MNYLWTCLSFCVLFLILSVRLFGFYFFQHQVDNESILVLNKQLSDVFSQPNKWGYVFSDYPHMSQRGLTYRVEGWIEVPNLQFTTIEEAEKTYIILYDDFYRKMTSVRAIRPFLANFPFTPASLSLNVRFRDSKGDIRRSPYISSVTLWDGVLSFNQYGEPGKYGGDTPFEVKCKKLACDVQGLKEFYTTGSARNPIQKREVVPVFPIPSGSASTPFSRAAYGSVARFAQTNKLSFVMIGSVGEHSHDTRAINFALRGSQCMKLDEARKLGALCFQELFDFVCKDLHCLNYIKERSTWTCEKYPSSTPIVEHLAFRISFWDESVDRPSMPYIAQIWLLDGKIKYYTADEKQSLVLVHEETCAEAQAYLNSLKS